jgi:WD40 repeat protein
MTIQPSVKLDVEAAVGLADHLVAAHTHKHLSTLQAAIFRGSWWGQKYEQIAQECYCSDTHVRIVGAELWDLLSQSLGEKVTKKTFKAALERYSQEGNGEQATGNKQSTSNPLIAANVHQDWGEAPDVTVFYGRNREQAVLKQWIIQDNCRLVTLLGMGGIGKTALSAKLAQDLSSEFDFIIWRSLRNAPAIEDTLADFIQFLSQQQETCLPASIDGQIRKVIDYLRKSRCLLILDNVESILQGSDRTGRFRVGFEAYGQLFKLMGETRHQSCLILTSREKPVGLSALEGETLPVRYLQITGLASEDGKAIFQTKGSFVGTPEEWQIISDRYAGNPLALNIVASAIRDFFESRLSHFLAVFQQGSFLFDDICDLLASQFNRLTALEKDIMYWLAINREPLTLKALQEDLISPVFPKDLLQAFASLQRRSLVEKQDSFFTQQPVVMEYTTDNLIDQICEEIVRQDLTYFKTHALVKATAKDYIRDSQVRLILQAISDRLIEMLGSAEAVGQYLAQILTTQHQSPSREINYVAGNLINLFRQLKIDMSGYDFSNLTVWQANLQDLPLHNVNFAHSDLTKSVFTETLGNILSATFSPDGQLLATCDTDCQIRLWQVKTGKLLAICRGHENWVRSVAFSSDSRVLASGGADYTVRFWHGADGACLKTCNGHSNEVFSVAFSPNGQQLVSSSGDLTLRLWQLQTGKCVQTFEGHSSWVRSVTFHPSQNIIASGGDDHTIRLWDCNTGECINTLTGHDSWVRSVAFHPSQNHLLASGSGDRTVKIWDYTTGDCIHTLTGHDGAVYSVAFQPNSASQTILASGSGDNTVRLWDCQTGQCIKTLYGHTNQIVSVAFSPVGVSLPSGMGQTLVCVSLDQTVRLWDCRSGQCLKTWYGHTDWALPVTFSPDHQFLASGSNDKTVKLWYRETGDCWKTLQGHTDLVYAVAFHPLQPNILASGSTDQTIRLWNIQTGQCFQILQEHTDWIFAIAFSPDGHTLISGSADNTLKLWDLATGQSLKTFAGHTEKIFGVAFSPDGETVASASSDKTVKLWDINTGECIRTFQGHNNRVYSVSFHPNNQTLVSGSTDHTIKLWEIKSGNCLKTFEGHTNWVFSVAFSPNGDTVVSGSHDQSVKLWNVKTGKCLSTFTGHEHLVSSVAFSFDGEIIASGSQDQSIRLWDIKTGECLNLLRATRLYESMNITAAIGLTDAQKSTLKDLGAIDRGNRGVGSRE